MSNVKHWVYELYADDQILYVGCSNNPDGRFEHHAFVKPWWPQVTRIEMTEYETRAAGLQAERARIRELNPPHNSDHTDHPTNRWDARRAAAEERHARGEVCGPSYGCKPCNQIHGPGVPKRIDWDRVRAVARAKRLADSRRSAA